MKNSKLTTKKILIIAAAVIVVLIIAAFAFLKMGTGAVSSSNTDEVTVEIVSGSGSYDIINSLDEAGLIKSKTAAKIYVRLFAPDTLQANTYVLNKSMSLSEMLDIISTGEFKYVLKSQFTIKPGETYLDASANISEALGIDQQEIIDKWSDETYLKELISKYWFLTDEILQSEILCPLEGYLYPDTYFVTDKEPDIESVTSQVLDLMDQKLTPYKDEIEKSGKTTYQCITFASVVQSESKYSEDKPKIAGVFVNRIEQGMPLQSDITVLYALGEKKVDVSSGETTVDSKYNTYKYTGLPIGPVSNPDITTIKASLEYESNDYLYFFAKEDGTVVYSKTYDEHLAAVEKYGWY